MPYDDVIMFANAMEVVSPNAQPYEYDVPNVNKKTWWEQLARKLNDTVMVAAVKNFAEFRYKGNYARFY
jgi:hypothetical protein